MLKFVRFLSVGLFFFLTAGCSLDARVDFSSVRSKGAVQEKVMMPGMSLTLEPTGGTPPFAYAPTSSGFLDTATGIYTVPINAPIVSEIVDVTDAVGEQFQVKVKVRGFSEHRVIPMPQGADDQNFPTDAVWLPSGELFISAIGSDYMGERWAVYRSTDVGATWTRVDQFIGMEYEGESFPMAMAGNANAVFTCGYAYSYNWEPGKPSSMWYVRRSLDRGLTWETADEFGVGSEDDFVCSDIAVAPGTDSVYATGYIGNKWAIRESRDNGTTWATIYEGAPLASTYSSGAQIAVAPNGVVFAVGSGNGSSTPILLRGQESSGTWSWTPITNGMPTGGVSGVYQLQGTLQVVDNLTAFYAFKQGGSGIILKTSDGGDSWSVVYTGQVYLQGLTVTSDGTLLASGGSTNSWGGGGAGDWKVIKSTDGGSTWGVLDIDAILSQSGGALAGGMAIVAHPLSGSVLAIQSYDSRNQVKTALSTDQGVTWSARGNAYFLWAFYDYFRKMIRDSSGSLYASIYYPNEAGEEPWSIWKSSDDGRTWRVVDEVFAVGGSAPNAGAGDLIVGHDGALYAAGYVESTPGSSLKIRRSTNGSTWTEVLSVPYSFSTNSPTLLEKRGLQETLVALSPDAASVQIESTLNGTTWVSKKTFTLPAGVNRLWASALKADLSGRLWLVLNEGVNIGALTTAVLYSSMDGVAWTEVRRGTPGSNWRYSDGGWLRLSEQGELIFWDTVSLKHSTDGGATWADLPLPADFSDVMWIKGQLFYHYGNGSGYSLIGTYDEITSSWHDWENPYDRAPTEKTLGHHDYAWASWKSAFLEVGPGEVYLQESFNDPYHGVNVVLRRLETSQ